VLIDGYIFGIIIAFNMVAYTKVIIFDGFVYGILVSYTNPSRIRILGYTYTKPTFAGDRRLHITIIETIYEIHIASM
jgi:hypothetical protein